jgi:hypothetical protein
MKLLYENTKACSGDVGTKIDELKRVLAHQSDALNGPRMTGGYQSSYNPYQEHGIIDPNIVKKGIQDIKE